MQTQQTVHELIWNLVPQKEDAVKIIAAFDEYCEILVNSQIAAIWERPSNRTDNE